MQTKKSSLMLLASLSVLTACAAGHNPDKTAGGTVLGAGWGAGAGAVVGNQIATAGAGAAVGAGLGAGLGLMVGLSHDITEGQIADERARVDSLTLETVANADAIAAVITKLDEQGRAPFPLGPTTEILFDADSSTLAAGTAEKLEKIAKALREQTVWRKITIVGHADDEGTPDYNARLSEARARAVAGTLASYGVSLDQIDVKAAGSEKPLLSNVTPDNRAKNRRVEINIQ